MAIVDDIVAVASRPRSVAEDSVLTVTAVGTRDGEARWRREIRGRDTLAVLEGAADGSDPILLANAGNQADLTGQYAWGWSGLAVLDARDGSMRWRRNLGIDATVQVRPAGALVVEERDGVAVVDGETGTTRLAWPSILDDADGHDWPRQARWTGSRGWSRPRTAGRSPRTPGRSSSRSLVSRPGRPCWTTSSCRQRAPPCRLDDDRTGPCSGRSTSGGA
jgi:outer membrane protein assembly factor BamB